MSVRSIEAEVSIKSGVQTECTIGREVIVEIHDGDTQLESLTVTENGTYLPSGDVDGYNRVTVDVPERQPVTEPLSVTENGRYTPSQGVDGYSNVTVNVPERIPVTESLSVTQNGLYEPTEGIDGYDRVDVAVPERVPVTESLTATSNGTYEPDSGVDGYDQVTVNVPERQPDIESLTVTANGTYTSTKDGYNPVAVAVPERVPDIEPLTVTQDGTYTASGDGYNPVTVNTGVGALQTEINTAVSALGTEQLVGGIESLTVDSNTKTGATDATLSDAVARLVAGYGGGASLPSIISKIDGGSFTPTSNEATSSYSIPHNLGTAPTGVVIWATNIVKETYASRTVNMLQMTNSYYLLSQVNTNGSDRFVGGALASGDLGASFFKFTLTNNAYKSGVTYKWLAWA